MGPFDGGEEVAGAEGREYCVHGGELELEVTRLEGAEGIGGGGGRIWSSGRWSWLWGVFGSFGMKDRCYFELAFAEEMHGYCSIDKTRVGGQCIIFGGESFGWEILDVVSDVVKLIHLQRFIPCLMPSHTYYEQHILSLNLL